jgi:hypothetical protein
MAFAPNTIFGIAIGREMMFIIGATATAGEWRACSMGSSQIGNPPSLVIVRDADIGVTCFPLDGVGVIPAGAPPIGARVQVTFSPIAWSFVVPITSFRPTLVGPEGIVFGYFSISTLGDATVAVVVLKDGSAIAVLPQELGLLSLP